MPKSTIDSLDNVTPTRAGAPDDSKLIKEMELEVAALDEQIQAAGLKGADVTLTDHEAFAGCSGTITWVDMCNRRKDVEVCYVALHTNKFGRPIRKPEGQKYGVSAFTDLSLVKVNAVSPHVEAMHFMMAQYCEDIADLYAQQDKS